MKTRKNNKFRKTLSCVLASAMAVSCMAVSAMSVSGAFDSNVEGTGQDIVVIDKTGSEKRQYDLYQIFKGNLQGDALVDITWGESLYYKSGNDVVYNLTEKLVDALKSATLPDGETNPISTDFQSVTKDETTNMYSASTIAGIVSEYSSSSEKIDAFASAVADVIEEYLQDSDGNSVQMLTQNEADITNVNNSKEYIFNGVESGYYMVSESTDQENELTYSKYMVNVGTGSSGTTIVAKATSAPSIEKYIVYGKDDPDTTNVDERLHEYQAVAVSDNVEFQLSSKVPDMDGYNRYYFIINDTLSKGLKYNTGSMVVTVGDEVLSATSNTKDTGETYEIETVNNDDGTTSLTIVFKNFIQYKSLKGKDIKVTYNATVDKDIVVGETNENTNTATLTYSNNPNYNYQGIPASENPEDPPEDPDKPNSDEPKVTTPKDTVYVYTTGVDIVKVDGNGSRLAGAEFKITSETDNSFKVLKVVESFEAVCYESQKDDNFKADDTVYYRTKSNEYTSDKYSDSTVSRYSTVNLKYSLGEDGEYTLDVNNGQYYYNTETDKYIDKDSAPSDGSYQTGYILYKLTENAEIVDATEESVSLSTEGNSTVDNAVDTVIEATTEATGAVASQTKKSVVGTVSEDNGIISFNGLNAGTYTITETKAPDGYVKLENPITFTISFTNPTADKEWKCDWTYECDNSGNSGNLVSGGEIGNGVYEIQVQNLTTHTLPSTGGIGTKIFYASGSVLAIGAVALLITKRRMRNEEE